MGTPFADEFCRGNLACVLTSPGAVLLAGTFRSSAQTLKYRRDYLSPRPQARRPSQLRVALGERIRSLETAIVITFRI